ncbi:MAG: HAD family hydrolase [Deltaproteobacteria bacterium]|nr:HAD family hydrolase [Deltaproteobacteria bacterium]MBW2293562.1 HAD family hydrolase [Deltaproteobacteria bacterium]MBW2387476.1 HAD family hydrolase [Deltaproteobacteria bacterium]MBW2725655.1 HAD family hydrolase [Deltaproteobacteria bacterium]
MKQSRVGAFFDMDKTIISENSASVYLRESWERGEVSAWDLARGLGAYLQYKLGALDVQSWTVQMLSELKGQREATMFEEGRVLFEKRMARRIYPEAARLIAEHIASGHVVAIVSGSIRYLVEPLAESLSVEHVLCTQLEAVDGVLTGRCIEPVCLEEGKIHWLQGFIEQHQIDLARSWFYSDSISDLPVLDLVGHPVATNPDPMLYRTATRRGWPVRIFDVPQ